MYWKGTDRRLVAEKTITVSKSQETIPVQQTQNEITEEQPFVPQQIQQLDDETHQNEAEVIEINSPETPIGFFGLSDAVSLAPFAVLFIIAIIGVTYFVTRKKPVAPEK